MLGVVRASHASHVLFMPCTFASHASLARILCKLCTKQHPLTPWHVLAAFYVGPDLVKRDKYACGNL